eukprot:7908659-Ditylum_brightwellii.AAC.1
MDAEEEVDIDQDDTNSYEDDDDDRKIEFVRTILKVRPDAALSKDKRGRTPLHRAASSYYAPVGVVKLLTEIQPSAALTYDVDGNVPLHLASRGGDHVIASQK